MSPAPSSSPYARIRAGCLAAVYILIGFHILHWKVAGRTLAPLELNEVLYTIHLGIVTAGFLFMAAALAGTLVFGRFFCGWACHMMGAQELSAWLLDKFGLRPRPFRSRSLAWLPSLLAFYLVAWPQLERVLAGRGLPGLRVQGDESGWASFVTCDFFRNLPGPGIAAATFLVCGALLILLLGSRSFCSAVCPYGTLFRACDALAPKRLIAAGGCARCGRCTAGCRSGVRVHEELNQFGTIIDPNCVKDLDCLGACPNQAIAYGTSLPPLLRGLPRPASAALPYSLTPGEDALLAAGTLGAFLALRGLYELIPLLLAAGLAVVFGFVCVVAWRLGTKAELRFHRRALRLRGGLTRAGRLAALLAAAAGILILHSGFVRYHAWRGEALYGRLASGQGGPATASRALRHLQTAYRWGLLKPVGLKSRIASLRLGLLARPASVRREE